MRIAIRLLVLASLALPVVAAGGCAGGGGAAPTTSGTSAAPRPARPDPNVLTQEEIAGSQLSNVYDLVSTLRPRWIVARGPDSFTQPTEVRAYLNATRLTRGLASLRELSVVGVRRIEFLDGMAASARWGLDHARGAIVVHTESR